MNILFLRQLGVVPDILPVTRELFVLIPEYFFCRQLGTAGLFCDEAKRTLHGRQHAQIALSSLCIAGANMQGYLLFVF